MLSATNRAINNDYPSLQMDNKLADATMEGVNTPFPSGGDPTTISEDFLALVSFASKLGTCVNNDTTDDQNQEVKDEAMLLMSLLMGEQADELLSDVKDTRCEKRKVRGDERPTDMDMGNFSFTFPSLSLQPDDNCDTGNTVSAAPDGTEKMDSSSKIGASKEDDGYCDMEDSSAPPSKLLSRTKCVQDKDMIKDCSESMAHNVLESFGAALVWRAKVWIKSLANVLALKEQKRIDAQKMGLSNDSEMGGVGGDGKKEIRYGEYADDNGNEELLNSREMQIIDAIVKSSEEVSVVNIKTSFRVLSNKLSSQNIDNIPLDLPDAEQPSSKKSKNEEKTPQDDSDEYKVTHKLMFEATISMTSNDGVRYNGVKLQAPGYIQGTFTNKVGSGTKGEETLTGVSMTLDTDALAQSLERQSRLVVRRSAEAALIVASGGDCSSSPHYLESPRVHHSIISPRYVLMSPVKEGSFVDLESKPGLPSIPTNLSGDKNRVVSSSSEGHSSDSSATTAATTPTMSPLKEQKVPSSPSLNGLLSVASEELTRGE